MAAKKFKLIILDGMAVYIGHQITAKQHTHHALEIVIAFDKPFILSAGSNEFTESNCVIIAPDIAHEFHGKDDYYIFLYFDAELPEVNFIEDRFNLDRNKIIQVNEWEIESVRNDFIKWFWNNPGDNEEALTIIRRLVQTIAPHKEIIYAIEPRIKDALLIIQQSLYEYIGIDSIASKVFLSESRFAHLFKKQTGIPFRKYVLWSRLQAAVKAVLRGQSFTQAAYEGGFSDVAHLSRTFAEMFGVSPSDVIKE